MTTTISKGIFITALLISLFFVWKQQRDKAMDRSLIAGVYGLAVKLEQRVIDYYYQNDEFPTSNASLDLLDPGAYKEKAFNALSIEPDGIIHLEFAGTSPGSTRDIYLTANTYEGKYTSGWTCASPNIPDIEEWMLSCSYKPE